MFDPFTGDARPDYERLNLRGTEFHRHSYSGYEKNKLFLNQHGKRFVDISSISGADDVADSRSWVRWDFNRDGWCDIAFVNANQPLLRLYRNRIGAIPRADHNNAVSVRFVGGNQDSTASSLSSNRDGIGAIVEVATDELRLRREHRCGEGYAAQNSSTLLIGIGRASSARVTVTWPSGESHGPIVVAAGQLVECYEFRKQSPNKSAFVLYDYHPSARQ